MKTIIISLTIALTFILLALFLTGSFQAENNDDSNPEEISENVYFEDEIQIVEITSRMGGYFPRVTYAKAGVETVLRMESVNSYGCERAFRIPELQISEELPVQGPTDFLIGSELNELFGTCSMGMYTFSIKFI